MDKRQRCRGTVRYGGWDWRCVRDLGHLEPCSREREDAGSVLTEAVRIFDSITSTSRAKEAE